MPDLLTIRQAVARAKEEGVPISESSLRTWVKARKIPVVYAGTRALVYYPNILQYIKTGDPVQTSPVTADSKLHYVRRA